MKGAVEKKRTIKCIDMTLNNINSCSLDDDEIEKKVQELRESLLADVEKMEAADAKK
jgi:hypothetical protein